MAHKRALKRKDIERLRELVFKHPGDRSPAEEAELLKLQEIRAKYGDA